MKTRQRYSAKAVRSGDWWAITISELKGVHSQARRLDRAELMAREAISLFLDVPSDSFDVTIEAAFPQDLQAEVERARSVRRQADELQKEAITATTQAARRLVNGVHLTVREAGEILGVSHQRIAQLLHR